MATNKPVPSTDPADLLFNAGKLDEVVNAPGLTYTTRLGSVRKTLYGFLSDMAVQLGLVETARATAVNTTIPAKVAEVEEAKAAAVTVDIPARVELVDAAVAATYVGQAGAAKTAAETAQTASEVALTAANAARDAALSAGKLYGTTTEGLLNTSGAGSANRFFCVPSALTDEYLLLYRNDAGVATLIKTYKLVLVEDADTFGAMRYESTDAKVLSVSTASGKNLALVFDARTDFRLDGASIVVGTQDDEANLIEQRRAAGGEGIGHITKTGKQFIPALVGKTADVDALAVQSLTVGSKTLDRKVREVADAGLGPYLLEAADRALAKATPTVNARTRIFTPGTIGSFTYTRMKNPRVIQTGANRFVAIASAQQAAVAGDPDFPVGSDVIVRAFTVDESTNSVTLEAQAIRSPISLDPDGGAAGSGYSWDFLGMSRNDTTGRIYFVACYRAGANEAAQLTAARFFSCYTDNEFASYTIIGEIASSSPFKVAGQFFISIDNIGLRLKYGPYAGRLMMAGYARDGSSGNPKVGLIYSDNNGVTWQRGAEVYRRDPTGTGLSQVITNESAITQLLNGDVLLMSRCNSLAYKLLSVSTDGGATFDSTKDYKMVDGSGATINSGAVNSAVCQDDAFTSVSANRRVPRVIYSGPDNLVDVPNSDLNRYNGTLYISYDDGRTFNRKFRFNNGYFGYSQPFPVRSDLLGVLSESIGFSNAATELDLVSIANFF